MGAKPLSVIRWEPSQDTYFDDSRIIDKVDISKLVRRAKQEGACVQRNFLITGDAGSANEIVNILPVQPPA
jgi:hypothetical protein